MTEAVVEKVAEEAVETTVKAGEEVAEAVVETTAKAINYRPIFIGLGCAAAVGGAVYGGKKLVTYIKNKKNPTPVVSTEESE